MIVMTAVILSPSTLGWRSLGSPRQPPRDLRGFQHETHAEERAEAVSGFARDVLPAIADGRITPLIGQVFAFDELPAAKACMESSATVGKIVVRESDGTSSWPKPVLPYQTPKPRHS